MRKRSWTNNNCFCFQLRTSSWESKSQIWTKFQEIEISVIFRVKKVFDKPNARTLSKRLEFFDYEDECADDGEEDLERIKHTLPCFGVNSGRDYLNFIKSYLFLYLICDKDIEPTGIETANVFLSFRFGDVYFLDIMKFLGRITKLGYISTSL